MLNACKRKQVIGNLMATYDMFRCITLRISWILKRDTYDIISLITMSILVNVSLHFEYCQLVVG